MAISDDLICGPLASGSASVEELAKNIYFAYLFDESVKRHEALQKKYKLAVEEKDEDAMSKTQSEIEYYDGLFNLTLSFNFDELES